MTHLLDTDICIYWLKGRVEVLERVQAIGLSNVAISSITVAELYYGAHNSNRVDQNLRTVEQFINGIAVIQMSLNTFNIFGRIKAELRRLGQPVADFDLLIASTAISDNLTLVTNNTRHYQRISSLVLENWMLAQT